MGAVGPAVADDLDVVGDLGMTAAPVTDQVVDDREEPLLGRIPRLEQVVVEADLVDRRDRSRASASSSIPVFSGIFWSLTMRATGSVLSASDDSSSSAWAADVDDSTRYSDPYRRFRSRVSAAETCGSSSTVRIVGRLIWCCLPRVRAWALTLGGA
jgi:hypothetical protein